jgi:hypothetical protein
VSSMDVLACQICFTTNECMLHGWVSYACWLRASRKSVLYILVSCFHRGGVLLFGPPSPASRCATPSSPLCTGVVHARTKIHHLDHARVARCKLVLPLISWILALPYFGAIYLNIDTSKYDIKYYLSVPY